jgi:hypothetical protein
MRCWWGGAAVSQWQAMNSRARSGSWGGQPAPRDRVAVASEKADFIADRIADGVAAPEQELRSLARYLREVVAAMGPGARPRVTPTSRG